MENELFKKYYNQASTFYKEKKYEDALTSINNALRLNPDNYLALYAKGLILKSLNRYKEASDISAKAISYCHDEEKKGKLTQLKKEIDAIIQNSGEIDLFEGELSSNTNPVENQKILSQKDSTYNLELFSGSISNAKNLSSTSGSIETDMYGRVWGSIGTRHWITFRVGKRPVTCRRVLDVNNGDNVIVVGGYTSFLFSVLGSSQFEVFGLHNETTGVTYRAIGIRLYLVMVGFFILLSTPGFFFILTIPGFLWVLLCLGLSRWMYKWYKKLKKANAMLYSNIRQ